MDRITNNLTTFGLPLQQKNNTLLEINLGAVSVFRGISDLVDDLKSEVMEQCIWGLTDVAVQKRLKIPELVARGLLNIGFYARFCVVEDLPALQKTVFGHLKAILTALQIHSRAKHLIPVPKSAHKSRKALLFPLPLPAPFDGEKLFFIVEVENPGRFLRITLESGKQNRLALQALPHMRILPDQMFSLELDITVTAENIFAGLVQECRNNRTVFIPAHIQTGEYLAQLRKHGFSSVATMVFYWPEEKAASFLLGSRREFVDFLAGVLMAIADPMVQDHVSNGSMIKLYSGEETVYLESTNKNRYLNLSFETPRTTSRLKNYLARMPETGAFADRHPHELEDMHVFLIHHITSEVLAVMKALQNMGAGRICTLFVKYTGKTPMSYIEALAECSEKSLSSYALYAVNEPGQVRDYFLLSDQYSAIDGLSDLSSALQNGKYDFHKAMTTAAGHLFFREAITCKTQRKKMVIVEDGGYLAPLLHNMAFEEKTIGDALEIFALKRTLLPVEEQKIPLNVWLEGLLAGSVEHTRNGYDALRETERKWGRLSFPSVSIAISHFKIRNESKNVAYSCLNALENIMNSLGLVYNKRNVLVLGSRGAIGGFLKDILVTRTGVDHVFGIDIKVHGCTQKPPLEAHDLNQIPKKILYNIDLFFGIIGESILTEDYLVDLLFNSCKHKLYFVSGSTKTVEFSHLLDWLSKFKKQKSIRINGIAVKMSVLSLKDTQSGFTQGRIVRFEWQESAAQAVKQREFYLLGGLQPINFLYYGVPTETMDTVMTELVGLTAGLVTKHKQGQPLPPGLLALDHSIDKKCNLINQRRKP